MIFGGKVLRYYFALGNYDGLGIVEFPDNVAVAAGSMKAASKGVFAPRPLPLQVLLELLWSAYLACMFRTSLDPMQLGRTLKLAETQFITFAQTVGYPKA
jgi:GYD domain